MDTVNGVPQDGGANYKVDTFRSGINEVPYGGGGTYLEVDTIEESVDKVPYDCWANVTVDTFGSEDVPVDIARGGSEIAQFEAPSVE